MSQHIKPEFQKVGTPQNFDVSSLDLIKAEGVSPKLKTHATQIKKAKYKATVELSRILNKEISELMKEWISKNQDYFTNHTEALSYFESIGENLVSGALTGEEIFVTWDNPETGLTHAVAAIIKSEAIKIFVDEVAKLPLSKTKIISDHANEALEKLGNILQKNLK